MAPKRTKKSTEKPSLKDCVIALAGDLGKSDWTDERLHNWIEIRNGVFVGRIDQAGRGQDEKPTHILATPEVYKKMTPARKKRLKQEGALIIHWDWLEDSINKKKRLKESDFRLDQQERQEAAKKREEEKQAAAVALVEKGGVNNILNRNYTDSTFFTYDIMLTRTNPDTGMIGETWRLRIWESNGMPKLYHCAAEYNKARGRKMHIRPGNSETPGPLEREMAAFRKFFATKTGICWHERIAKAKESQRDLTTFTYEPPTGGKPVGEIEDIQRHSDQAAKDFEGARFKAVKEELLRKRQFPHGKDSEEPSKPLKRPCPGIPSPVKSGEKKPQFAPELRDLLKASHQPSTQPRVYSQTIQSQGGATNTSSSGHKKPKQEDEKEHTSAETPGEEGDRQLEDAGVTVDDHRADLRDLVEPHAPSIDDEVGQGHVDNASTMDKENSASTQFLHDDEGMLDASGGRPMGTAVGKATADVTEDGKKNTDADDGPKRDLDIGQDKMVVDRENEVKNDNHADDDDDDDDEDEDGEDETASDSKEIDEDKPDAMATQTRPTIGMKSLRPTVGMKTPRPANYGSQAPVDSQLVGGGEDYNPDQWLNPDSDDEV